MSTTREEMAALVADVVAEHFERLRADLMTKMLDLRTPHFKLTAQGELYCDGDLIGDVRPVFQEAVDAALKVAQPEADDA
jgi:hypothetical protein